jgi:hydroxymethylbilane synthase
VDDRTTRAAVTAERTVLAVLEAGCSAPVGAYAVVPQVGPDQTREEKLHLTATVVAYDGSRQVRLSASGHPGDAERIGRELAAELLARGADQLMGERD